MHDLQPLSSQIDQLFPASFKPFCVNHGQVMAAGLGFLRQTWEQEQGVLQLPLLCLPETPPHLPPLKQEICRAGPRVGRIILVPGACLSCTPPRGTPGHRAIPQGFLVAVNPRFSSWSRLKRHFTSMLPSTGLAWAHWHFQPSAKSVGGRLQFLKPSDKMFWGELCWVRSQPVTHMM